MFICEYIVNIPKVAGAQHEPDKYVGGVHSAVENALP